MRKQLPVSGREQAVVAHLNEAVRQDVLQEATYELGDRDGGESGLFGSRVFVLESDVAIFELEDAAVGDGYTEDVRGEVFEGSLAAADRLFMNHPGLPPN